MISAGEVHTPGRPKESSALKRWRFLPSVLFGIPPGGVRIHAGAPVIEQGMVEEDFKDLAAAGVTMLGEVGLGSVKDGSTAREMVAWARNTGFKAPFIPAGHRFLDPA